MKAWAPVLSCGPSELLTPLSSPGSEFDLFEFVGGLLQAASSSRDVRPKSRAFMNFTCGEAPGTAMIDDPPALINGASSKQGLLARGHCPGSAAAYGAAFAVGRVAGATITARAAVYHNGQLAWLGATLGNAGTHDFEHFGRCQRLGADHCVTPE